MEEKRGAKTGGESRRPPPPEQRPTLGVVGLQVLIGQLEKALDSLQRHLGLQEAVELPRERVEWNDQHSHQGQRGEHLPTDPDQSVTEGNYGNTDVLHTGVKEAQEGTINNSSSVSLLRTFVAKTNAPDEFSSTRYTPTFAAVSWFPSNT